jgi:hypothetical protein
LKKTSLGPLRQRKRLDTSETKPCSSKEHKPPMHTRTPPAHMRTPPERVPALGHKPVRPVPKTGQTGSQNRSGRLPKSVRPVTKIGQTDLVQQTTPSQKPKMQKKCTSSPLTLGIGSRDAMQVFSSFLSPPCCQCMNQGTNLKR